NLFPSPNNPELTIRRRSRSNPTLLNSSKMAAERPGDLPVPDLRNIEKLCQPSLNGQGGPIALIVIQATNFGLKNDTIQQVQNSCQFHGLSEILIPSSIVLPPLAILKTFMLQEPTKGTNQGQNQPPAYQAPTYQALVYQAPIHQPQIPQPLVVSTNEFTNFIKANDAILKNMQTNMTSLTNSNLELKNLFGQFMKMNTASSLGSRTLLGNTITNPKKDLKGITTRRGTAYPGPTIPTTSSSLVIERETEVTKDTVHPTYNGSTKDEPTKVILTNHKATVIKTKIKIETIRTITFKTKTGIKETIILRGITKEETNSSKELTKANDAILKNMQTNMTSLTNSNLELKNMFGQFMKMNIASCSGSRTLLGNTITNPKEDLKVSAPRPNSRPSIPYPSRLNDQKLCDKANDQREKLFQIFKDLNFNISFANALILMPKFGPSIKSLLTNKDKLYFDDDPRVPLILGRSFLKIGRALIHVFKGELTLRVGKEAITFNLDQTLRYSANYNDMTANRIDVINMACEDDFLLEEVDALLALKDDPTSPEVDQSYVDIEGDVLLLEYFLNDDPSFPYQIKEITCLKFYAFLEGDDKLPVIIAKDLSVQEKTALITVLKSQKRAIAWKLFDIKDEPHVAELKELPPHLEYAFLEGDDKCPS
nr:hypothetical protein [Tanacetum cinerariifolium]